MVKKGLVPPFTPIPNKTGLLTATYHQLLKKNFQLFPVTFFGHSPILRLENKNFICCDIVYLIKTPTFAF